MLLLYSHTMGDYISITVIPLNNFRDIHNIMQIKWKNRTSNYKAWFVLYINTLNVGVFKYSYKNGVISPRLKLKTILIFFVLLHFQVDISTMYIFYC